MKNAWFHILLQHEQDNIVIADIQEEQQLTRLIQVQLIATELCTAARIDR